MKFILLILGFVATTMSIGQDYNKDFDAVSKAILEQDSKIVSQYYPHEKYGPFDYSTPDLKESKRIKRPEFEKELSSFFDSNPVKEFTLLAKTVNEMQLPTAVGKYVTKNNKTLYLLMLFAKFEGQHGFVMFHFVDELPDSLKKLEK